MLYNLPFGSGQLRQHLREHLIEKRPISDVCQKHQIQPTLFYLWQKKLFEDGAVVFETKAASVRQQNAETQKIQEGHIVLGHIFCGLIERQMFPRPA